VTSQDGDLEQAREFAAAFRRLLDWIHTVDAPSRQRNSVTALVRDYLGHDAAQHSVVSRQFSPFEHVNLQVAINAWSRGDGRSVETRGISLPPHYSGFSLQHILSGAGLPPVTLSAPAFVDLPSGPDSTLACLRLAVLLVEDESIGRYIVLIEGPGEHEPVLRLEVAGLPVETAQAVLSELEALRARLNVYRGHVLEVGASPMGGATLTFANLPVTRRDDVILPEPVLLRVEKHALGVAAHRDALLRLGQHVKRGLLMFGPPGTGKTHTMRYVVTHMAGYTRFLLSGRALHAIGSIADLARELAPAVVVLEDVDLVAQDRSFGPDGNPILFELLDTMDGAAPDADILFLLTTNRADLLEPALAARPGRVDVAVQIDLPDAEARRRLFELYARGVPLRLQPGDVEVVVERTEGVTASFLKELVRRAVLEAAHDDADLSEVTAAQVTRALDDLLDSAQEVTRTLLGVGVDPAEVMPGSGGGPHPAMAFRRGWWSGGMQSSHAVMTSYSGDDRFDED
jgi:hypothetical protein